jgi:site-specific DNA recombinase
MSLLQYKWLTRTYVYARTSNRLNPVDSIPAQTRMIEKYAKRNGLEITDYITDEMKTGTNQNRPGFQKLLNLVEEGLVGVIIVAYFDRLGRNSIQMSMFLMNLKQRGIECISVGQNKKLSQMGEREIVQEAIYADVENRNRTNRLKSSQKSSLKKGEYTHSIVPLGYDKNEDRKLIPNKDAEYVKMLFRKFLDIRKVSKLVHYVKETEQWNHMDPMHSSVRYILKSNVYLGNLYMREEDEHGGIKQELYAKNSHQALIDEDTFIKVQEILNEPTNRKERKVNFHLFTGILICSKCGGKLMGAINNYKCMTQGCKTTVLKKHLEPKLLAFLQPIAETEYIVKEKYNREIKYLEKQQEKAEMDYATLKISKETLKERLFRLDEEMKIAYEDYMKEGFKIGSYKELIEKNQLKELKEVMIRRSLKIEVQKINYKTFQFKLTE